MSAFFSGLQSVLGYGGWAIVIILCIAGTILSCLTISGTWLVVAATVIAALLRPDSFPSIWVIIIFVLISAGVEVLEAISGALGIKKRGGSGLAGFAALAGGIGGIFLGGILIPLPIVGSLAGMLLFSFLCALVVEHLRLKKGMQAAYIAYGAVLSRVFVLFLKVTATLGMIAILWAGTILS